MQGILKKGAKAAGAIAILKNPITWILGGILLLFISLFAMALFVSMSLGGEDQFEGGRAPGGLAGPAQVSAEVLRYEPLIRKYAEQNGIGDYTGLIMALIQQESGGRHLDVMQSSESIGLPPGTITDPEYSIMVGVGYFAKVLKQSKGDINLALQSYNMGSGFIPFALKRGGYSKEVATQFSDLMAARMGWSRYGDIHYVDNVMRFYQEGGNPPKGNGSEFVRAVVGNITSPFGVRNNPFSGAPEFHAGIDIGCGGKPLPIFAAKGGVVTKAGWQNPANPKEGFGQRIYIDHGSSTTTIYAHLSDIRVKTGQKVHAGELIGNCGTTGSSTGTHLHLELLVNGNNVDPEGNIW
jgi:murein DD-endopeptidase MepM/ murein hydrolase activator NlpD